jgi:hypothetical protein
MVIFGSRRHKNGKPAPPAETTGFADEGFADGRFADDGYSDDPRFSETAKPVKHAKNINEDTGDWDFADDYYSNEGYEDEGYADADYADEGYEDEYYEDEDYVPKEPGKVARGLVLYAYMPLAVAYLEVVLRLFCGYDFKSGLLFSMVISAGTGLALNVAALVFRNPKVSRAIAAVLLGLCCFMVALQYFMYSTYGFFMSFDTIFTGVGDVLGEFVGVFASAILAGIPMILLFFLPLVAFLVLTRKRGVPFTSGAAVARLRYAVVLAIMVTIVVFGRVIILRTDANAKAAHDDDYDFDTSSRRLGILAGVGLEIQYAIFGNPHSDSSFTIDEPPPGTTNPTGPTGPTGTPPPGVTDSGDPLSTGDPSDPPQTPIEYGYNMYDLDFDAIIAAEGNSKVRSIHEYVSSLQPSRQNEYTGIFEGKNLILIAAEAFSAEVVDPVMTPTLYRLVHNGFYFSDYYQPAWGGSTSSGEYAILTGLAPTEGVKSIQKTIGQNLSYTIGNKLKTLGYFSASYHNGSNTYYSRNKTHTNFGYETFTAMGNGMETFIKNRWPNSDLEMMQYSVPKYIDKQPFSVYYMTVSGHALYSKGGNSMSRKNWDAFPEQYAAMSDTIRAYMACNLELEYALKYLVDELEARGIADDTVIVLSTDHYPYALEKAEAWGTDKDYLNLLFGYKVETPADRDHSALIIWSGSLEGEHKDLAVEVSTPTYSLDILPTLCNLFGVKYDSRMLIGRDVFSDAEPLVLWLSRHWKTDHGFVNATSGKFIPAPGAVIPDGYEERMKNIVRNKITYSGSVLERDYFDVLFDRRGTPRQ